MRVVHRIQAQAFDENILASATTTWSTTPLRLTKPRCTVWLTRTGFYRLSSTSPAKPAASGVCSLIWAHLRSSSTPFSIQVGRSVPYTKILERWLITTIFFLFLSQEQNIATQAPSTISRLFACLDRIVHLTETSTHNEQPICPPINSVGSCHPSSVFIQQYVWGSKSVSLASSEEQHLYQVRRRVLVNLFWDSQPIINLPLIIGERGKRV